MSARHRNTFILLTIGVIASLAASIMAGTTGVPFSRQWAALGLPRLLMGLLAGASLATAGAMFQSLFRNPLASPYTLGVSSGASLGATIVIAWAGAMAWYSTGLCSVAAFAGALLCVTIVYTVARMRPAEGTGTLLLTGITIGFICSAMIVFVLLLADRHDLEIAFRWMVGSLQQAVGMDPVYEAIAMLALAGGLAVWLHRDLDLLMMGEQVAAARGVSVRWTRRSVYFAASLMTAIVVARCGPIGFVGLMVPHIARHLVGPTHRYLLPASALVGAMFLPLCDVIARNGLWWLRGDARQMPVGALTNLIGGLFFLYLLLGRRRGGTIE